MKVNRVSRERKKGKHRSTKKSKERHSAMKKVRIKTQRDGDGESVRLVSQLGEKAIGLFCF